MRLVNYGGNLELFIEAPGEYSDYYMCNPSVARRYFFMQNTVPDPPNDLFLKEKTPNGYRIFVVGGSTTAGYPYANNILFSRILQFRLQDVFPDKKIEVVNTAMTAVNTYTILDFIDEIIAHKADAILVYSGHNEFYGALGAASSESLGRFRGFVKLYLKLQQAKTFLFMRDVVGLLRKWLSDLLYEGDVTKPSATLMERMVGEQTIPLHSPIYQVGRQQFEGNLRDIVNKAKEAGVRVIVSELVSNIRDMKPFLSVSTDSLPPAEEVYRHAAQLEREGKFELAKKTYTRAKDLDALRFRATEEFNVVLRRIAEEIEIPVVPMKSYFEKASPHGLIGNNLILEHLHPNIDGYFMMADAFFDVMHEEGFVSERWDSRRIHPEAYYRENWGITELDKSYADLRIKILKGNWPFKPKSVPNRALIDYEPRTKADSIALKVWIEDINLERGHVQLAEHYEKLGQFDKAYKEYKSLIYITPHNVSPYLRAAHMLIKARKLNAALPYLRKSLELEDTAFANKWIGQILLDRGLTKTALLRLEKAAKIRPQDAQLIYNLSGAYALNGQFEKAKKTLKRLEKLQPDFPGAQDLKRQLDSLNK
ncbi:tetratricopeptide repeat protein [candidate division KSB1 bacterium]|nr:tetratricopeptide repeat protein [candidate division KSB1 bacterium]NIU90516.1 tetratricopeptide repeat protein [candidate division KSB1 bacterium]NIV92708.1 tetratricopeptide repeat protein [candidate division KSB1 bacterium]NIW17158.1 tetratricopeptide repeat protein [candidate division KSB1 bacterium]NIW67655.1 tetratricopeptide repeat protein [candidate division KSB1 bacterium]